MIMRIRFRILDNLNLAAMLRGYRPGDQLRCVWESEASIDYDETVTPPQYLHEMAESLFVMFNHDNRPNGKFAKSMSVGDVIQFDYGDGRMFLAVDTMGFVEVEDPGDVALNQEVPMCNVISTERTDLPVYYHDEDSVSR